MACSLSEKQIEALFKAVLQSIVTKLRAGQAYDPEQYMRDLYGLILKRTQDPVNAMDYIQHIPRMIITAYNISEEIADYLTDNGVDLNRLDKMRKDFKDIENIKKFVSVQENQTSQIVKEIVEEETESSTSTPSDRYSEIEQNDKANKTAIYRQPWFAYPATALATSMQEAQDYGGIKKEDNIQDPDPRKQTYYKVVRKVNEMISSKEANNASKLKMGPVTGIYLRLVHATSIPNEELYESDKAYFNTEDSFGTPEQKRKKTEEGDEVRLVFSDKDGNMLYFDKDGNVTTKEEGGTIAYTNLRRARDNNFVAGVQDVKKDLARKEPQRLEEFEKQRKIEIEILKTAREYISKNRNEIVLFNIQEGNNGYTTENFSKPVKISSLNLEEGFNPTYSTISTASEQSGGVYFSAKPYPYPVLVYRPKFDSITGLADNLADIVFGTYFTNEQKINILKQFSYSKDTSLYMKDGELIVSQMGEDGKLERFPATQENKAKFTERLKTQTVNIVGNQIGNFFDNPVNLDGKVQLVKEKYNRFIADNFFTYLQANSEGNLISLNAYNVIQPTAESQKKIFGEIKVENKDESSLTEESPTDQSLEALKNKLKGTDFSLKKSILLDNFAALDKIAAAEEWYKNSPLAKVAPFQQMFHIINSDALAEFTLAGVTLYKGANFTDLYHEGFHVFTQMFLTRDQKKSLYNETRKLIGSFKTPDGRTIQFKNASDIQLEEFLAEDFRKYILSDGKTIINGRSVRNSIFRKIWNFLKDLFKTGSIKQVLADRDAVGNIKEIYDNLFIGNINQYKPSLNNVQFSILNKGAQALNAKANENKGLSYQDSSVLVQTIDSMIAGILGELKLSLGSVFTNPELMGGVYEGIKIRLNDKRKSFKDGTNEANIIDFALANWGDYNSVLKGEQENGIIAYHKLRSSYLSFDERFAEMDVVEQDEKEEIKPEDTEFKKSENELRNEFGSNAFERKGNEASVFELASNETIYLIKSLPKLDKNGKPELNILGEPKLVDFNRTWGIVINSVQGAIDKSNMYRKLQATSKLYPEIKALVERLGEPREMLIGDKSASKSAHYHMWNKFYRDMDVYKIPIKELQIEKVVDKDGMVTEFKVSFRESDPLAVQVERKFVSSFENAPAGRYITKTNGINTINLANVVKDYPNTNDAVGFLRAIGLNMTDNPLVRRALNSSESQIVTYIHKAVVNAQQSGRSNITINTLLRKGKDGLDIAKNIRQIFIVEAKYSGNYTNNSISNVKDDPEFDLSLNNSITKVFKELNNTQKDYAQIVSQPHMAHLDHERNPDAKYSFLLKSMFNIPVNYEQFDAAINKRKNKGSKKEDSIPVSIDIVNLNGIKMLLNKQDKASIDKLGGIKTAEMDINSKFLMDIHTMLLAGVQELPRHASKSMAYGVSVSALTTPYNSNARYLYVSTGHFADATKGMNYAADLLKMKVAAEMERIAKVKAKNLDKTIPSLKKLGRKFAIFDDILGEELQKQLIDKADANNSFAVVNSEEFSARVNADITTYLEKLYAENLKTYKELGYLSKDLQDQIRGAVKKDNPSLTKSLSENEILEIGLRSFTANSFIHNIEMSALLYGGLYQYEHDAEEFHKRNAGVGSTGRGFSWDVSDQEAIGAMLAKNSYAKKLGLDPYKFNGELNTAVFQDNILTSAYFDEYVDAIAAKVGGKERAREILKPYTKMKEGDGQGWITFDAYKILATLEGNWSDKQNELYIKIVNGETVNAAEVIEFFPPRKFQYAGPLKTDDLHIQGFHKFSLAPIIPSVAKGTNLEVLHRNLLQQNMHYALFNSGSKISTITKDGQPDMLYENNDYKNRVVPVGAEYTPNTIFIQYLKNQVDVSSTWKEKTIFSTQLRKLIINDLFKKGLPISEQFGKLIGRYESLLDTFQKLKKEELLKEIGWKEDKDGNLTGNLTTLVKFVRKELTRQDLADHDIEFIDLDASRSSIKRDLSFSLNAEKIEKLLNAVVVKRLIRQKLNGDQLVQVSGALYEKQGFTKASKEDEIKYGTNDLPTYQPGRGKNGKTSAAKIKIAIKGDYYRLLALPDVKELAKKEGISGLDALNRLIKDEAWLDKDNHRKMITLTGVRIPVQGFNSMEFMEVYEFLPEEAGNILIPPAEIVAKSGGDFDIDKLTVFQANIGAVIEKGRGFTRRIKELQKAYPSLNLEKNNVDIILDIAENDPSKLTPEDQEVYKLLQTEFGRPEYINDKSAKGVENKINETIREILEHPDVFDSLIRPNDTDLVKGAAKDLAKYNIQGYNHLSNKTKASGETISPTRVLEPRYNLYKHESNNIGKKTLGIGAVDNAYSSIFKRVGAYLNPQYTFRSASGKMHKRNVRILMPHNTMNVEGKDIISLSDIYTKGADKISDLISQLMNGWVDIEKDAWIFNINGNNTAGPILLFLLEAGVDFKTAAYFVSQPLVVRYIKALHHMESPFYEAAGSRYGIPQYKNKGSYKYLLRTRFIESVTKKEIKGGNKGVYENILNLADNTELTEEELYKNIKNADTSSKSAIKALVHFFELEDMAKGVTGLKLTVNVDTKPSKSFYDAQERMIKIQGLTDIDIFNNDIVKKIIFDSPIRSFFTQAFQLKIWKPLMKLRADKTLNEFLMNTIKNDFGSISEGGSKTTSFRDAEKFVTAFKNDLPLYMMQNYLKNIDIDNIKEYHGLFIQSGLPVQEVQLKYGAFVKDGVMYIDPAQIRRDFDTKAFNGEGYQNVGLYKLSPSYFNMGDALQQFKEYSHFVIEREYLRSITPVQAGQNREAYEKDLAERALRTTYNWYNMLKGPDSIANQFEYIKNKYPELVNQFLIFEQVNPVKDKEDKGISTLKLASERMTSETINTLHENLIRLSDFGTIKVSDPVANREISAFFNRMIVGEYLRAGISKSSESLSKILPSENLMRLLEEPMHNLDNQGINPPFLNEYYSLFTKNWAKNKTTTSSNKFRNYISTTTRSVSEEQDFEDGEETTPKSYSVNKDRNGVNVFTAPTDGTLVTKLLTENGDYTFVYQSDVEGKLDGKNLKKKYKDAGNSISIPILQSGTKIPMTDQSYDNNVAAIDQALKLMEEKVNDGETLAFPKNGLTTVEGKEILRNNAPRTYTYLVTELYKRFGFVHPGAETDLGFRTQYQSSQVVTDQQVDEFMKKCFGN